MSRTSRSISAKIMSVLYAILVGILLVYILLEPAWYFFDYIQTYCTPEDLALCVFGMTIFPLLFSAITSIVVLRTYKRRSLLIGMVLNYGLIALAWIFFNSIKFLPVGPHPGGTGVGGFTMAYLLLASSFLNLCLIPFWIYAIAHVKHW
jgi:hypothetical protein